MSKLSSEVSRGYPKESSNNGRDLGSQSLTDIKQVLLTISDCLLILAIASAVLLINLGSHSLGMTDEVFEVGAAQEMYLSGNWLLPTIDGQAFFDKPPFKMWLTAIPVSIFGPSNFSFRILDVLFGMATLLLTYAFSRKMFASRFVGIAAVFLFLGCRIFVVEHGMRHAVQDSLLVFFSTAILYCGWQMEHLCRLSKRQSSVMVLGVLCGILGGCAFLTKSAGALMPFLVFGCYLTLSGKLFWFIRSCWKPLLACAIISLSIASSFFVTHCLTTPGACHAMFYHHVYKRVNGGVHNISGPWFYLVRLYEHRAAFVPEILTAALGYGVWRCFFRRDSRYILLLIWSVLPVALYSVASTKLSWYIAPAFPAMAILIAAALKDSSESLSRAWCGTRTMFKNAQIIVLCCFLGFAFISATYNYASNISLVSKRTKRIDLDLVTEDIQNFVVEQNRPARIVIYKSPKFTLDERNYHNIIKPYVRRVDTLDELSAGQSPDFVFTGMHQMPEIAKHWPVEYFSALRPIRYRSQWIAVLGLSKGKKLPHFTHWKQLVDFGDASLQPLFGFGGPEKFHSLGVRYITGDFAAISLEGNAVLDLLGAEIWINMAAQLGSVENPLTVEISLNDTKLDEIQLKPNGLDTHKITVPQRRIKTGINTLFFRVKRKQGEVRATERPIMFNWLSLRLNQRGALGLNH